VDSREFGCGFYGLLFLGAVVKEAEAELDEHEDEE
jgi:hypothetical protein